jgi:hypothetical protein
MERIRRTSLFIISKDEIIELANKWQDRQLSSDPITTADHFADIILSIIKHAPETIII